MRNLAKFLENPFDDPSVSMAELIAFTTDHLERMISNNPANALDTRIADTSAALGTVGDCVNDDQLRLGVRKARKDAKDNFRENLRVQVKRIEGALEAAFGPGSAQVMEALPQGRNVFNTCPDDAVSSHLNTLKVVVIANTAQIQPAIVTLVGDLVSQWASIYSKSESATGAKTTTEEGKRAARAELQLQLYRTLGKLMDLYPRQPEKLPLFMRQSLLEDQLASPPEPEPDPAPPPGP